MKQLFVDISAHGFGHLAQTAPLLNALADSRPLQLTLRSGLPRAQLARRIHAPFTHIHSASDFGFAMRDALNVDIAASAARYQQAYADWPQRVAKEAELLAQLAPDLVFSNVSPLPLAGAAAVGIPGVAMCSLNWADLFAHYYADTDWGAPIHAAMQAAYASARMFLRLTPGMPMDTLPNVHVLAPVSFYTQTPPTVTRREAAQRLALPQDKRWLLLALGGIAHRLPVEDWPALPDTQLLVPADWNVATRADITPYHDGLLPFSDLLPVVDVLLSKPGYGTFVEAACCGLPVLYLQRPDWPEADCLEQWLHGNARAAVIPPAAGISGDLGSSLNAVLRLPAPPRPAAGGSAEALRRINALLDGGDTIKP
ncbi:MAG TPA: hypothetical protein VNZ68_01320 [Rhodocyclaceae bacterium]|nr:hypothetical protein [Rhodocyclaceae bacterium]